MRYSRLKILDLPSLQLQNMSAYSLCTIYMYGMQSPNSSVFLLVNLLPYFKVHCAKKIAGKFNCYQTFSGIVLPEIHSIDYLSVIIQPGHCIELQLLSIAACNWASLSCTQKHHQKSET